MNCPRCGYDHFIEQQPCPRCGFTLTQLPFPDPRISGRPMNQPDLSPTVAPMVRSQTQLSATPSSRTMPGSDKTFAPDMSLQRNHYVLVEQRERQQWGPNFYEARWLAQDLENKREVILCEVALPVSSSRMQEFLRTATRSLLTSSNTPNIARLLNVFMERGHGFFVFKHFDGESLQARVQRGQILHEQEAIDCFLQMAEILSVLSQQNPPIVHGAIQPSHIVNVGSQWALANSSVLIAGDAAQFLSPGNIVPELTTGATPAADLFALTASIFYAVTGIVPTSDSRSQQAQLTNAAISPTLTSVLLKGINPRSQERYQKPSEIINVLRGSANPEQRRSSQERRSTALPNTRIGANSQVQRPLPVSPPVGAPVSPAQAQVRPQDDVEEATLLPRPEDLPPLPQKLDSLAAMFWTVSILCATTVFLIIAR